MVAAYRFKPVITLLLLALLLVAVLLSLALGPVAIPLGDTLRVLLRWFSTADLPTDQVLIIEHIRLPRTLMGILVGATLALSWAAACCRHCHRLFCLTRLCWAHSQVG